MTPLEGARAWVAAWQDGWARHQPDVIAARYAPDCRFRSEPFRALEHGRAAAHAYATHSFEGLVAEHRDTWTELEGDHGIALVKEDLP